MKYKHLFFDLDKTLWDFESNSSQTLNELFIKYNLTQKGVSSSEDFIESYRMENDLLWEAYRKNLIEKEALRYDRFNKVLIRFGIDDSILCSEMAEEYVIQAPLKTALFPYTIETLTYLHEKYSLHIITNGFEETQHIKLHQCGIKQYFQEIITSEKAEAKKPEKLIFDYSLNLVNAKREESIMIGDDLEVDLMGAKNAGIDQIYFNPQKLKHYRNLTFEINCLSELRNVFSQ